MEIEVSNLKSKLHTDNQELLSLLNKKYSFYVPGYNYVPAYRRKVWDGKKAYFSLNGQFKTGLLNRILKDLDLVKAKYNIKYVDKVEYPDIDLVNVEKNNYRDYQEETIKHCLLNKRVIVNSPTGSGKTIMMAGIIKSLQKAFPNLVAVVLFKEKGILTQTYEFFKLSGIDSLGINFGEGFIEGNIMLSTVQSIEKILDTHLDQSTLLMIDEAHQFCKGDTTIAAIESFKNATYRFAFTGTVPSDSNDIHGRLTLEGAFGAVYDVISAQELIDKGNLADPIIQIVEYAPSGNFDDFSYQEIYEDHIVSGKERNDKILSIVNTIYKSNSSCKLLILVKNLAHLKNLRDSIENCYCIEGKDNIEERYKEINSFLNSSNPATLIGTNVLQTGININEITHMINARGLEGEIPTLQGLGRGLRVNKDKTKLYFYDFYDKVNYLEKHSKKRIKHYKKLGFKINYVSLN